jgi:hypothetical protein
MTTRLLHLPGQTNVPIACDMSAAKDTPDERIAEWSKLFEKALLSRERLADSVVFSFRDDPGTRERLEDLARREHACCPFLDYRVDVVDDDLTWTTTNVVTGDERASIDVYLDALLALPDHAGSDMEGLLDQLADRGVNVVESSAGKRFELG